MSRTGGGSGWADVKELKAAADGGNAKAQAQYGEMLLRGDAPNGVTQDRALALTMLEQAARAGQSSAAFRLGMVYDDGEGVPQDRTRALAYFKAAAAGGATEAFHNIGAAYSSARGVKRDYAEGLAWLMVATKRGASPAGEEALRAHIAKLKRPELLVAAEKRSVEIAQELSQQKAVDLLPSASTASKGTASAVPTPTQVPTPTGR